MKGSLDIETGGGGAAVSYASKAEAEAGTDNTKAMTPLRVAQAIEALGGGASALDKVACVDASHGNDAAADGSAAKPFKTLQAAYNAGKRRFFINGSVGGLSTNFAAADLYFHGVGVETSIISGVLVGTGSSIRGNGKGNVFINALRFEDAGKPAAGPGGNGEGATPSNACKVSDVSLGTLEAYGGRGGNGGPGYEGPEPSYGGTGGRGADAPTLIVWDARINGQLSIAAGNGGHGGTGGYGQDTSGGWGGTGGDGGSTTDSYLSRVEVLALVTTSAGLGGEGGAGGGGDNGQGMSGYAGTAGAYSGTFTADFCRLSGWSSTQPTYGHYVFDNAGVYDVWIAGV